MLIGYTNSRVQKICTSIKEARKALPQRVADQFPTRIRQLEAFDNLALVPATPPFRRHKLAGDYADHFAVAVQAGYRIVFMPAGPFEMLPDGTPNLETVEAIALVAVEDYHD